MKKSKSRILADRKRYDRYRRRAELWARGATLTLRHLGNDEYDGDWTFSAVTPRGKHEDIAAFATHAPLRWHITAVVVYRTPAGDEYRHDVEAECGQAQTVDQLRGLRDELMRQARKGNSNHAWDEYFLMRVL